MNDPFPREPTNLKDADFGTINAQLMETAVYCGLTPELFQSKPLLAGIFLLAALAERRVINSGFISQSQSIRTLRTNPELLELLADALSKGDFSSIYDLPLLQEKVAPADGGQSVITAEELEQVVRNAWTNEYIGDAHLMLLETVKDMCATCEEPYTNSVPIIQSSGSGKSRTVDELAKIVFVIPLNIREEMQGEYLYPPADKSIYEYLVGTPCTKYNDVRAAYFTFFKRLFAAVRAEIEHYIPAFRTMEQFASTWREHLAHPHAGNKYHTHRDRLYEEITNLPASAPVDEYDFAALIDDATEEGSALAELIKYRYHRSDDNFSILIYVDEAQTLATKAIEKAGHTTHNAYEVFREVLSDLLDVGVFTMFLSTNLYLHSMSPTRQPRKSKRVRFSDADTTPIPYFEMPWTVLPDQRPLIAPGQMTLAEMCDVEFSSQFGRPLWRGLLRGGTPNANRILKHIALSSLTGREEYEDKPHEEQPENLVIQARLAALSARLLLEFYQNEPAKDMEMRLVQSHMAWVYGISDSRQWPSTGYPSEPIVAEAAAHVMHRLHDKSAADVLAEHIQNYTIKAGEKGELVMRLLLTEAFDKASREMENWDGQIDRPVPLLNFIGALFGPDHLDGIKQSYTDNRCGDQRTFAEAFKDAYVRFTHFARLEDNSLVNPRGAWIALTRAIAWQCNSEESLIDCIIPVAIGDGRLSPDCMTAILIQAKNRPNAVVAEIDESKLNGCRGFFPKAFGRRPYITLMLELGVRSQRTAHVQASLPHVRVEKTTSTQYPTDTLLPHPRFPIIARGCSPRVYAVVKDKDSQAFTTILRGKNSPHVYSYPHRVTMDWIERMCKEGPTNIEDPEEDDEGVSFGSDMPPPEEPMDIDDNDLQPPGPPVTGPDLTPPAI